MVVQLNEEAISLVNNALDQSIHSQSVGTLRGIFIGEEHHSPTTRLHIGEYLRFRQEEGRPLSCIFLELSEEVIQPLLERFMAREPGADEALEEAIKRNVDPLFLGGLLELCHTARDTGTRIVAMDLPPDQLQDNGERLTTADPQWSERIRREMSNNPEGEFLVFGGMKHMPGLQERLNIPGILMLDILGAGGLLTLNRQVANIRNGQTFLPSIELPLLPPITPADIESSFSEPNIFAFDSGQQVVILPNIQGYSYVNPNPTGGVPYSISRDTDVYFKLQQILSGDVLDDAGNNIVGQILDKLSGPEQICDSPDGAAVVAEEIRQLTHLGTLSPDDATSLRRLADNVQNMQRVFGGL